MFGAIPSDFFDALSLSRVRYTPLESGYVRLRAAATLSAPLRAFRRQRYKAINPLWSLIDPLAVEQVTALVAGFDPNLPARVVFLLAADIPKTWASRDLIGLPGRD